jgi:hypothetical protein
VKPVKYLRTKKREYLKDKINELETKTKMLEICKETYKNLSSGTSLELIL